MTEALEDTSNIKLLVPTIKHTVNEMFLQVEVCPFAKLVSLLSLSQSLY